MSREEYIALYSKENYDQWDIGPEHERSKFMLDWVQGPDVLDAGCGGSGFTRLLDQLEYNITAVDINPYFIVKGRARLPRVEYIESLLEEVELTKKYDSIIMMEVFEHILEPEKTLAHLWQYLKPDGRFIITTPHKGSIYDHVDNHLRQYDVVSMGDLLRTVKPSMTEVWKSEIENTSFVFAVATK